MHNQISLVELNNYSAIDVIGVDAAKFLQGQLTINVNSPTSSKSCLAALCNPKGRIVSLFHIVSIVDGFRLIMPQTLVETSLSHLKKYGVFFKVDILESSVSSFVGLMDFSEKQLVASISQFVQTYYQLNNLPMAFVPIFAAEEISQLSAYIENLNKKGSEAWFSSLARNKVCWLSEKSSAEFLPHDLDLPNQKAVDFNKGCFTGQEVIARMQYKGKLKQHLQLLQSNKSYTPVSGEKMRQEDKLVGKVICSITTENNQALALGLIKDSVNKEMPLAVDSGELFLIQADK